MDAQLKRGLLDTCVLAIVSKGDTYGYKLTQDTLRIMEVSESALYPVLKRLETQGCLTTYSQAEGGRLRRYYSITPIGGERLTASREELGELKEIIDFILGGQENDT